MTPEEKSLLERTLKTAEDNNRLLHALRRSSRYAMIGRIIYWVIILLLAFGAFYFIQPYVNSMMELISGASSKTTSDVNTAQNVANQLKELFK